jgi:response regulator NasT
MTSVRSILICDDEPIIRACVKNRLKELGFDKIFECCDANSAVSTACETLPDIALLDVAMPRKEGLSAAREIRQKLKIPVILLMPFCDTDTLTRAKKIGITAILAKPFRGQDLLPALEMAFAHAEEIELLEKNVAELKKTIESQEIIDKAKEVLLRSQGLSEAVAYRKIQKLAMDKQKSMRQIAEAILITEGV